MIVVVGNGMVGHRFVEAAVARRLGPITVVGEERRAAYDRVHLSSVFDGAEPADLALCEPGWYDAQGVELVLGDPAVALDPAARTVTTAAGRLLPYDDCVLATGSFAFVPPIEGTDAAGCFVYRTLDDLDAIRAWASGCTTGVVVGGGLLGLEAANALRLLGLDTSVVEFAPRLMAVQLDDGGGRALRHHVEGLGLHVRTGAAAAAVRVTPDGRVAGLSFAADPDGRDGSDLDAELVVFAAGIRPRDDLARAAGLAVGERGGVVVDDGCATSAPGVWAVGEVACHAGRVHGLVAPGYEMADVVADRLADAASTATFAPTAPSVRLKLLGVDVATVGDLEATGPVYQRVVRDAAGAVLGATLVGDLSPLDAGTGRLVCSCHNVGADVISEAARTTCDDVACLKACTKAGTGCGSCVPVLQELLASAGKAVDSRLCRHFAMTRAELFDVVRVTGTRTFAGLVARHGAGDGCEVCKPAVASMFASLASGYILDGEQGSLQDTNDHLLANIQRDGTYSVVPRVPGGEITPEKLIAIGEVARDFGLYTKITGGQRIDLLGATAAQLPAIWARLLDAGFESGHAYGKAVRTVKSCVGSVWCRYGVQDSVQLAIDLELRYRGLRAPHKIKLAVSGCARECAEAQSKDVGVIATENGWNLYVGGNGGMRPAHAELLASDLDTATLVRFIDRYLMYYVRTADRLERTATWQRKLDGGLEQVRRVVVDDALGIAADLEADMARHVEGYECEWKATLASPERLARFSAPADSVPVSLVTPGRGVSVTSADEQVAVFALATGELFALDDLDPFSGAPVLSRGIVGEVDGVPTVASPMYKQRFDLRTGQCLDDPSVSVGTHEVVVSDGRIAVQAGGSRMAVLDLGVDLDLDNPVVGTSRPDGHRPELLALDAGEQYRFGFDMGACIGCHSCEVACAEQNGLPPTTVWRRVGEVEGGAYPATRRFHISMSCNHCLEPACLDGCPTNAYEKLDNGVVAHHADGCIGCQYCTWNCPYSVPAFQPDRRIVTKCDLCQPRLAEGMAPACVSACPTQAITVEKVDVAAWRADHSAADAPQLPSSDLTLSTTRIVLPDDVPVDTFAASDWSLRPEHPHWPLVWLTLLSQLSVGTTVTMTTGAHRLLAAGLAVAGMLGALLHLGRPAHAWKALRNLRRSWLSREVALLGLHAGLATVAVVVPAVSLAVAAVGIAGVYASARLYVVPGRPAWDSPLTIVRFVATASATGPLLTGRPGVAAAGIVVALVATAANWLRLGRSPALTHHGSVRLELRWFRPWTVLRLALAAGALVAIGLGAPLVALAVVLAAEGIGRWLFFVTVVPMNMPGSFFR